jgi:Tol biopolymer transport system component
VLLGVTARRAIAFVQGWLLFINVDGTAIQAVRLDEENRRVSGTPITVLEDPAGNLETGSLADNGTLLRVRRPRINAVMFVDSVGAVRPLLAGTAGSSFMHPRMSPDGKRLAVQVTSDSVVDVWVYDMASRTPTRLTTTGRAYHPTWTPDGRRIVFFAAGRRELFMQSVDGGAATTLAQTEGAFAPTVTPDGRSVVFQRARSTSGPWSIWSASLMGAGPPRMLVDDPVSPYMPALSPDGRWLAYVSSATRRDEVYARPFDGPGQAVLISDSGGTAPAWSSDGHRIYYRNRDAFVEVVVTTPALAITSRRRLFDDPFDHAMPHRNYDVAPGNTGFLMIGQERPEAVITLNWATQLRSKLKRAR